MKNLLSVSETAELMDDFIGIKESQEFFGDDVFTKRERDELNEVKFSRELTESYKDDYLLIAIPGGLSILDLMPKKPNLFNTEYEFFRVSHKRGFANRINPASWYLIGKDKKINSEGKNWEEQKSSLNIVEYIPDARTVIYTAILYFLKNNIKLFSKYFVRTADFYHSPFERVVVIFDKKKGISIFPHNNGFVSPGLGCAVGISFNNIH